MTNDNPEAVNGGNSTEQVIREPMAIVDVGHGCRVGIMSDDGCFLVLYPQPGGGWKPGKHIPRQAVEKMAELLATGYCP